MPEYYQDAIRSLKGARIVECALLVFSVARVIPYIPLIQGSWLAIIILKQPPSCEIDDYGSNYCTPGSSVYLSYFNYIDTDDGSGYDTSSWSSQVSADYAISQRQLNIISIVPLLSTFSIILMIFHSKVSRSVVCAMLLFWIVHLLAVILALTSAILVTFETVQGFPPHPPKFVMKASPVPLTIVWLTFVIISILVGYKAYNFIPMPRLNLRPPRDYELASGPSLESVNADFSTDPVLFSRPFLGENEQHPSNEAANIDGMALRPRVARVARGSPVARSIRSNLSRESSTIRGPMPSNSSRHGDDAGEQEVPVGWECSVCTTNANEDNINALEALPCGHTYHRDCIDGWRTSQNRTGRIPRRARVKWIRNENGERRQVNVTSCPLCRKKSYKESRQRAPSETARRQEE